jgi:hypothetical protein
MSSEELKKILIKKYVSEYKKNLKVFLLTSRFTNETWNENIEYKMNKNIGCIYCSPSPITNIIPIESIVFVLEMNNDTNKILGIGMIRNHPYVSKFTVYNEGNYNRYVYVGKNRIDRNEMFEEEEKIMKVFDILCFTGNKHMKRGQGLKSFPIEMLYKCSKKLDLVNFIKEMFKKRINNTN